MNYKSILLVGLVLMFGCTKPKSQLPLIAVANYGPHASLQAAIDGMKASLAARGYIEHKTVRYEIEDVNFEPALIPQMIAHLQAEHPAVMVVITTPVAQFAKGAVSGTPLVYGVVTDPVQAGLIVRPEEASVSMTGSADKQDLTAFLKFAKQVLPHAKRIGLLYASAEINDLALVNMMKTAAKTAKMTVLAVPVDEVRDIPQRMQLFKDKVDVIYVGASGPIQPAVPVIASYAAKLNIPVMNVEESAVREGLVLASFGVSYKQVGVNIGTLVAGVLKGTPVARLQPIYPNAQDHHGLINTRQAQTLGVQIPRGLKHVETVG